MNLVFVTPAGCDEKTLLALVEEAAEGGADAVQLRCPGASARVLFPLAKLLKTVTERTGAALYVNDRADVALAAETAGVHLGVASLPVAAARAILPRSLAVGVSCHNVAEAIQAQEEGADYIFLGTIFASPSKPGVTPLGLDELSRARREVTLPIVAIGGVTVANVGAVLSAGANGVAVISAIAEARSPRAAARALADALASWRGTKEPTLDVSPK